jgi:hypothetical protein
MISSAFDRFKQIWCCDFEFPTGPDLRPGLPWCMVASELRSGATIRLWRDELQALTRAPFDVGPDSLLISYSAAAEMQSFMALSWVQPRNVVDLFAEYLAINNPTPGGQRKLIHALAYYGLAHLAPPNKHEMQQRAITKTVWTPEEKQEELDYCESDVVADRALFAAMPIELGPALVRGRYVKAVAAIQWTGIPIDAPLYRKMVARWDDIKRYFIERDAAPFGVYEGLTLRDHLLAKYAEDHGIDWPLAPTGLLKKDHDTWRALARKHPELQPLQRLTSAIVDLRIHDLPLGSDGFSHCWLAPFRTLTGRNQPSPNEFPFAMPGWLRGIVKPPEGFGIAYLDWSAQEVAVMAALSGDPNMISDVAGGDPYLAFGKRARLIPEDATKKSHGAERDKLKRAVLAPAYGQTAYGLAAVLQIPVSRARELIARHEALYARFYAWQRDAVATAQFTGSVSTAFGWRARCDGETGVRTIMNFFAQATAAEMMRCAAIAATESGLQICAPVHDGFVLMAPLAELDDAIDALRRTMERAALVVTNGLPIKAAIEQVIRWPDRFPPRLMHGRDTWDEVMTVLRELGAKAA